MPDSLPSMRKGCGAHLRGAGLRPASLDWKPAPSRMFAALLLVGAASLGRAQEAPDLPLAAQGQVDLRQVLERLDRLETQNRELMTEIRALRQQLGSPKPIPETLPVETGEIGRAHV